MRYIKSFEALSSEEMSELRDVINKNRVKIQKEYLSNHPFSLEIKSSWTNETREIKLNSVKLNLSDSDYRGYYLYFDIIFEDNYYIFISKDDNKWEHKSYLPMGIKNGSDLINWIQTFLKRNEVEDNKCDIIINTINKELKKYQ